MSWLQGKLHARHASSATPKPRARHDDLIIEDLEDEILIYDSETARAHCLTGPAALVWRAADGTLDEAELSDSLDLDSVVVTLALSQLGSKDLLEPETVLVVNGNGDGNGDGHTRREFGGSAVKLGAAVASAPMIYSILAPTPAAAATPSVAQCLFYSAQSCDGCTNICGCCCCCEGCSSATQAACKICLPTKMCSTNYFNAGCAGIAGVNGACSSGPHCSATAPNSPQCPPVSAPVDPSGSVHCCYPPCTTANGSSFATLKSCGNGSQPCNCTNEAVPC